MTQLIGTHCVCFRSGEIRTRAPLVDTNTEIVLVYFITDLFYSKGNQSAVDRIASYLLDNQASEAVWASLC